MTRCERCGTEIDGVADICAECATENVLFINEKELRRLRELERTSKELIAAIDANRVDAGCKETNEAYLRELRAYEAWRKAVPK
jgi:hypothetical protein